MEHKFERWLRVSDGDVQKALAALKANQQWRLEHRPEDTLEEDFADVEQSFDFKFLGLDLNERPVMVSKFGEWDVSRNDALADRVVIKWFEAMEQAVDVQTQKLGRPITQVTAVHDMSGFSLRFFSLAGIRFLIKMLKVCDSNYAGIFHVEYCINCPAYLSFWISLLKPFMSRETASNLRILGQDPNVWKKALLQDLDSKTIEQIVLSLLSSKK